MDKRKKSDELIVAKKELAFQNEEKEKRVAELIIANKELAYQNQEKEKRAKELIIANKELVFQNKEKQKRADELVIANKELAFQNKEKEKRAAELIVANKELAFQNKEKEKRAVELIVAKKEKEKEKEKLAITNEKLNKLLIEKNQAEVNLMQTNEYLENLFLYANAPIIVWDTNFNITRFNPAFEILTGRKADDVIGTSIEILFPADLIENSMELIRKTRQGERWETVEINIIHTDDSVSTVLWNSASVLDTDGKTVIATIAQGQDITGRKLAEEALRASDSLLQSAINILPVGLWIFDAEGKIVISSAAAQRIWAGVRYVGVDQLGEYKGWRTDSGKPIEANEWAGARALEKGETSIEEEVEIECFDGTHKIILDTAVPLRKSDGSIGGAITINQDITERKLADEKIKTTYDAFISILNAYPGILKIIDPETHEIILVNKTFADKLPQYGKEKKCYEVFYELTSPCDFCTNEIIKNNNKQQHIWEHFNPITKKDYLYTDQLIKWPDGRDVKFEVAIDISERKKAEDLLKISMENLERSNKELEQFAYVASHDLQEPLRMVSSYTQLIERRYKDKLDQDANDFIQYAVDGANRMQKLINDLLDYSRITSRGKDFTNIDISQLLGQTISNLQQLIIENTALITNEDLPELKADESQILRVFQNLIENAIKFKKKAELPKIHISCKKKNDFYEFAVKDNGIGMNMQFHDKVFTIFQRLHSKEEYPGTGIGLSICKRIIERHDGKIWFESKENEGTTFYFTLKK